MAWSWWDKTETAERYKPGQVLKEVAGSKYSPFPVRVVFVRYRKDRAIVRREKFMRCKLCGLEEWAKEENTTMVQSVNKREWINSAYSAYLPDLWYCKPCYQTHGKQLEFTIKLLIENEVRDVVASVVERIRPAEANPQP